jgi:hypothetical protein
MRLSRIGIVIGVLLAGCSNMEWVHPNKPPGQFTIDHSQCETQSMQDPKVQQGSKLFLEQAIDDCLARMGWRLREKP